MQASRRVRRPTKPRRDRSPRRHDHASNRLRRRRGYPQRFGFHSLPRDRGTQAAWARRAKPTQQHTPPGGNSLDTHHEQRDEAFPFRTLTGNSDRRTTQMPVPGFTAETSLCPSRTHYRVSAQIDFGGGLVHPAGLFDPNKPVFPLTDLDSNSARPLLCLKILGCHTDESTGFTHCRISGGVINPITHRCE
jgi:hypothetical protein